MKKILIFYASYGGGHLSAAKSINNYLNENYPDIKTELVDCMKYINIISSFIILYYLSSIIIIFN